MYNNSKLIIYMFENDNSDFRKYVDVFLGMTTYKIFRMGIEI